MSKPSKFGIAGLVLLGLIGFSVLAAHAAHGAVLDPKGLIGHQERRLMIVATLLGLLVIVPVFVMLFFIAWKYREGNTGKAIRYTPEWDHSRLAETIWWTGPLVIILILSAIIWRSTHALDPFKPLASSRPPLTIQVVALQWKWLFIYPEQHIATVNYVQFPAQTPVNFEITADAPMNSFWIPQLGGQIYAMAGMSTQLHLMADGNGSYAGSSANLSGAGFSGMRFTAKSTSAAAFSQWVSSVQQSTVSLNPALYSKLAQPSANVPVASFGSPAANLYDSVIMKYMAPTNSTNSMNTMAGMSGMSGMGTQ
jgi:cytochrome o ubiquinol oxidase subunit 2